MANRSRRLPTTRRTAPFQRFFRFGNYHQIKKRVTHTTYVAGKFVEKRPFVSFFIALGILFLLILLGSTIFRTRTTQEEAKITPKNVTVYRLGESPRITVQGDVKKNGVVQIVAQTPGIVSTVNVTEGEEVAQGKVLLNLASNYQGANAFTVQRKLAAAGYQNTKETYDLQQPLLQRQRDLAHRQENNAEGLRKITEASVEETEQLINLNVELIDPIKTQIQILQANNGDPATIAALQAQQSQIQAGLNQLQSALRAARYQANPDSPANDLTTIGRDIALKQLDIQERALKFSLQSAGLQLKLAQIQESTMYPSSPFAATVQKVHVKVGETANPGAPLVTLAGYGGSVVIDAKVPSEVAVKVSKMKESQIEVNGQTIQIVPFYVSTEATTGQLYSVLYTVDESYRQLFTDKSFVTVSLPVGTQQDTSTIPFIPVDSVFQTQNQAFVYVLRDGRARTKTIKLGPVTGNYVTVEQGLSVGDQVILNRTVIDGDPVKIQN